MASTTHPLLSSNPLSLLIKKILSFSFLNASLPLVCIILEAHKWNNLVPSVIAPQAASVAHLCIVIVLETCQLKRTMLSKPRHKVLRFKSSTLLYKLQPGQFKCNIQSKHTFTAFLCIFEILTPDLKAYIHTHKQAHSIGSIKKKRVKNTHTYMIPCPSHLLYTFYLDMKETTSGFKQLLTDQVISTLQTFAVTSHPPLIYLDMIKLWLSFSHVLHSI